MANAVIKAKAENIEKVANMVEGATTTGDGGAIGLNSSSASGGAVGQKADTKGGGAVGLQSVSNHGGAVGWKANTKDGGAIGQDAFSTNGGAVGKSAKATLDGGAIGHNANTEKGGSIGDSAFSKDGFAGGYNARAEGVGSVQLGSGTNTEHHTLQFEQQPIIVKDTDGTYKIEKNLTDKIVNEAKAFTNAEISNQKEYIDKQDRVIQESVAFGDTETLKKAKAYTDDREKIINLKIEYDVAEAKATLQSPSGKKFRLVVDDSGNLSTEEIL